MHAARKEQDKQHAEEKASIEEQMRTLAKQKHLLEERQQKEAYEQTSVMFCIVCTFVS
jgi:hypothetical protein